VIESVSANAGCHADDFPFAPPEKNAFTDRILVRKDRLRELFIKHANLGRVRAIVVFREIAATQQRDAQGVEIMARHKVVVGTVAELRLVGSSWNTYGTTQTTPGHRRGCGDTRCFHSGQCFESSENL